MSFRIVRNDITKMNTDAIVEYSAVKSEDVIEEEVFITRESDMHGKAVIHAVTPLYSGSEAEEEKLRSVYCKSLQLAKEQGISSVAFPLISSESFGYPKEEAIRTAVDGINIFPADNDMEIFLVVGDEDPDTVGSRRLPALEEYIDRNYISVESVEVYDECAVEEGADKGYPVFEEEGAEKKADKARSIFGVKAKKPGGRPARAEAAGASAAFSAPVLGMACNKAEAPAAAVFSETVHESRLNERIKHTADTFTQYLLYLIKEKGLENAEVYKRAIVDKKVFSKIKNNIDYHPQKLTVLCLCIGAKLNLDESKDLLARAGYALSPCDKTDIIFSYFIENEIYDMIELDIQLEEHGLPCIIS